MKLHKWIWKEGLRLLKRFTAAALCCVMLLTATVCAQTDVPSPTLIVSGQTWDYLDQNTPGEYSAVAYSLGGRAISEAAQSSVYAEVEFAQEKGFPSTYQLGQSIISLIKLGEDPQNYKKINLLSTLYTHKDRNRDGLTGACYTLLAYQAAQANVPTSARNSISSVVDYIVSSQQRSGGFAVTAGREPSVEITALAVLALSNHKNIPYVESAIRKAVNWLSLQQNANATFSDKGTPSCFATASVLIALRANGIALSDKRFVKNNADLLDGMNVFANTDGGYAPAIGAQSQADATELAVIAMHTNATGLTPVLPPAAYPGYVAPEQDGVVVYLKFFVGFAAMLGIVYLLLILTGKIGKRWGGNPPPKLPNPYEAQVDKQEIDTRTMEIHIPMQADLPDFDGIDEEENTSDPS